MKRYIVCDAGGTKAEFLLFTEEGRILAHRRAAGANAIFTERQTALEAVESGIRGCLADAGLEIGELAAIALFIPGFKPCLAALKERLGYADIRLEGDEWNAFYGALGKGEGIAVLAGTGSFAVGRDPAGREVVAGGWGPAIGDRGSGYHIGTLCLSRIAEAYDEGRPDSRLASLAFASLGVRDVFEMRSAIYRPDFDRRRVGELCRVVEQAAREGDALAGAILDEAADELARLAAVVARRLGGWAGEVSLVGGVANMGALITVRFEQAVLRRLPGARVVAGRHSPAVGGMLCLLKREGRDITEPALLETIRKEEETLC